MKPCLACGSTSIHEMFCWVNWKEMGETYAKREKEKAEKEQGQPASEASPVANDKG